MLAVRTFREMSLRLVKPDILFEVPYKRFISDFGSEPLVPFPLNFPHDDFPTLVRKLSDNSQGKDLPKGFVANSSYWFLDNAGKMVGASNLRHRLTEALMKEGGHIGYGVGPSFRKKGHATKILEMMLQEAKCIGISEMLVTCDKTNEASRKTIFRNGGIFDSEELSEPNGKIIQRFWIKHLISSLTILSSRAVLGVGSALTLCVMTNH